MSINVTRYISIVHRKIHATYFILRYISLHLNSISTPKIDTLNHKLKHNEKITSYQTLATPHHQHDYFAHQRIFNLNTRRVFALFFCWSLVFLVHFYIYNNALIVVVGSANFIYRMLFAWSLINWELGKTTDEGLYASGCGWVVGWGWFKLVKEV